MFDPGPSGLGFYVLKLSTCKTFYRYAVEEQRGHLMWGSESNFLDCNGH